MEVTSNSSFHFKNPDTFCQGQLKETDMYTVTIQFYIHNLGSLSKYIILFQVKKKRSLVLLLSFNIPQFECLLTGSHAWKLETVAKSRRLVAVNYAYCKVCWQSATGSEKLTEREMKERERGEGEVERRGWQWDCDFSLHSRPLSYLIGPKGTGASPL